MNILILDGCNTPKKNDLVDKLHGYAELLEKEGHQVTYFTLADLNLKFCIGCFGCWVKHPGKCIFTDDQDKILLKVTSSDLVVFGSPLVLGFVNSLIKKVCDRLIPLLLPYVEIYKGEIRHVKRYKSYPKFGLIIQPESDTEPADLTMLYQIFSRTARNFHTEVKFIKTTENTMEDMIHATISN